MNGKILRTGTSRGATIRSPKPPKEHAVEFNGSVALCGAVVSQDRKLFAFSPFACRRCTQIINARTTALDAQPS
jgi:hypothetical protein